MRRAQTYDSQWIEHPSNEVIQNVPVFVFVQEEEEMKDVKYSQSTM